MLKNAKKSIVGVFCKVLLKIKGRTQNKVKIWQPRIMKKVSVAKKYKSNAPRFVQSHQFWLNNTYRTI